MNGDVIEGNGLPTVTSVQDPNRPSVLPSRGTPSPLRLRLPSPPPRERRPGTSRTGEKSPQLNIAANERKSGTVLELQSEQFIPRV